MNSSAHRIESRFISQTYKYDAANRLIGSNGNMSQEYSTALPYGYQSNYKYTLAGKLLNKYVDSKRLSTAMGPYTARYDNEYSYTHPNNPYAVTHIQDAYGAHYDFSWSANGNLDKSYAYATHTDRRLCWTEDNRLQAFMERGDEGGIAAYYNYTADGERNIKLTSPRLNMHQNASLFNHPPLFIPTLYASPLITLTAKGYTKHYFEEGRRVCSKLGGGFLWRVPADDIRKPVEEVKDNYEEQHNQQRQGVHETFGKCIGAWPELIDKYDLLKMLLEYKNDEKDFYYHSDHLGSAAYLTSGGDVTQTLNYLPYGEDWIDVQNNMDPRLGQYRFNGKEKDYESGFHYYGARYYWSELLTGWLSVDPMADKYPSISPYNYCMWNPIKLVDPDGMDTTIVFDLDNASIYRREDTKRIGLYFVQVEHGEETTLYSGNTSYDRVNVGNNRTIISFKDAKQARDIYNYLKDNDVQFEWNLMFLKDGSADLVTSALLDKISMDQDDYSSENVESWRHYHPSFSGYLYWMPSERDQEFALSLGLCPSILDFCGQEYDFAPIIKENKNKVFTAEQYVRYKGILEKKNPTIRTYCK